MLALTAFHLLFNFSEEAFIRELCRPQPTTLLLSDGGAEIYELIPWPNPAYPVASIDVKYLGEITLDLIPVMLDQVEDDCAFPASSKSITSPFSLIPSGGGFTPFMK